jgi:hypothetical protein
MLGLVFAAYVGLDKTQEDPNSVTGPLALGRKPAYLFIYLLFAFHRSFGINPLDTDLVKHKQIHVNKIEVCTVILIGCNEHLS